MEIKLIQLQQHGDERGSLVVLEAQKEIPFSVRRMYYMYGCSNDELRGKHAHKKLRQMVIAIHGSCVFSLDNGVERHEILLNNPTQGLLVEPWMWHEMSKFSIDCVLFALADDHFDEADYIRDYQEFLRYVAK